MSTDYIHIIERMKYVCTYVHMCTPSEFVLPNMDYEMIEIGK